MIALSEKILQIHNFGNKCLIKTDNGLIPQNEHVSYLIKYIYNNPSTIESISQAFVSQYNINASLEEVKQLVQKFICDSNHSNKLFILDNDNRCISNPLISGTPNRYVPYLLNIELTNMCNLNCTHCYKEANCNVPTHIDLCKLEELLSFLNSKNLSITLTGGEPTIHKSFEDIVELCSNYGTVDLVTNGLMLKNISPTLLKKINLIGISLYGIDDETYRINTGVQNGFLRLTESIEHLISAKKNFILTMVLDKEKINNLEKYIDVATKFSPDNLQIGLPFRNGKLAKETEGNEHWLLTDKDIQFAYRKIREHQKKAKIKILDWERDVYEKKYTYDDPNNPSNFYKTHCMKCGAGTTQWTVSESFTFRPCNLLSGEIAEEISFEVFKMYVDGKCLIDWKNYMNNCRKIYFTKFGLQLSECCKRLTDFIDEK